MIKSAVGIILAAWLLSGCSAIEQMKQDWIRENCNPSAAYNNGMRDGLSPGRMPERNYASWCYSDRSVINAAYMQGFSKGIKARPQEVNVTKTVIEERNDRRHH